MEKNVVNLIKDIIGNNKPCSKGDWKVISESLSKELNSCQELTRLQQENDQLKQQNKDLVEVLKPFADHCRSKLLIYDEEIYLSVDPEFKIFINAMNVYDRSVKSE